MRLKYDIIGAIWSMQFTQLTKPKIWINKQWVHLKYSTIGTIWSMQFGNFLAIQILGT